MSAHEFRAEGRERLSAIAGGAAGNFVEWFDWFVFVSFSIYFSSVFFPPGDKTVQLLQSAAVFASGFVIRPLGAWFFGFYADHRGRRAALSLSVGSMCAGAGAIAACPGYAAIGPFAPAALIAARLLQGFSVGGEYGSSATYISEMAGVDNRGFWSSFQCVTLVLGQLTALCCLLFLQSVLPAAALEDWGWRLAFATGAVLSAVAFWIRRGLVESLPDGPKAGSVGQLLSQHLRPTILVFLLTAAGSTGFYVYVGYSQKFLTNSAGFSPTRASGIAATALVLFLLVQPVFGALSDFIGRRRTLAASFGLCAVMKVPALNGLSTSTSAYGAGVILASLLVAFSGYSAIGAVVKAELFPAEIRALGVGLPYAAANAVFGGTAEFLALWSKHAGREALFFWYVAILMLVGAGVAAMLPETGRRNLRLGLRAAAARCPETDRAEITKKGA